MFIMCREPKRQNGCCLLGEHNEDYNIYLRSILTTSYESNLRILGCFLHVNRSTKGLSRFATVQGKFSFEQVIGDLVLRLLALSCQQIYRELIL